MEAYVLNQQDPVVRWLQTLMCEHYAETFEAFGYRTLQKVCSLNTHTLLSMGVSDFDAEKIMENVSILRQTCFIEPTYNNFDHFDPKIDQRNFINTKQQNTNKKLKPKQDTYVKSEGLNAPPNVTIQNASPLINSYNNQTEKANEEAAKRIVSEILEYTRQTNLKTKYTCVPLNKPKFYETSKYYNDDFSLPNNNEPALNDTTNINKRQKTLKLETQSCITIDTKPIQTETKVEAVSPALKSLIQDNDKYNYPSQQYYYNTHVQNLYDPNSQHILNDTHSVLCHSNAYQNTYNNTETSNYYPNNCMYNNHDQQYHYYNYYHNTQ